MAMLEMVLQVELPLCSHLLDLERSWTRALDPCPFFCRFYTQLVDLRTSFPDPGTTGARAAMAGSVRNS